MQEDDEFGQTIAPEAIHTPTDLNTPVGQGHIAERYEILGLLGSGGMGNVYKVRDTMLDEVIALKTLHRELATDPMVLARFRREVKLARRVTHPHVARTFDMGADGEVPYLTMEFIEGEPLHTYTHQEGRLSLSRSLDIITKIARGLGAAHEAGVIHRDLKPPNIMISGDRVVITDFGIARVARRVDTLNTAVGGMIGTPTYMAPEQVEGKAEIDHRADIYALGVMLYELVTGRPPWEGDSLMSIALARLLNPPPRLDVSGVPPILDDVVARALARFPEDRYPDVSAFHDALESVRSHIHTGQGNAIPKCQRAPERTEMLVASTAVSSRVSDRVSVAVLPIHNRAHEEDAYLAEGLTEEFVGELSMASRLRVKPTGAARAFQGLGALEIGRRLGVDVIVEGSMRRVGDALRVRLVLISVEEGFQIWGKKFRCAPSELLDLAEDAAEEVAQALVTDMESQRPEALTDPVAIDLYMRGRYATQHEWMSGMTRACSLLERARERAPNDPRILTGLAVASARRLFFEPERADELLASARAYAKQAVEIAPDWADTHYALAMTSYVVADFANTIRECNIALEHAPEHLEANDLLGRVLSEVGPLERALVHIDRALNLNESLRQTQADKLRVLAFQGKWEDVELLLERFNHNAEGWSHHALTLRFAGWRENLEVFARWNEMNFGEESDWVKVAIESLIADQYMNPEHLHTLRSLIRSKTSGQRRRLMYQLLIEFSLISGEKELALLYLEEAVELGVRDLMWLTHCPLMQKFEDDARYHAIRRKLHERLMGAGTLAR